MIKGWKQFNENIESNDDILVIIDEIKRLNKQLNENMLEEMIYVSESELTEKYDDDIASKITDTVLFDNESIEESKLVDYIKKIDNEIEEDVLVVIKECIEIIKNKLN